MKVAINGFGRIGKLVFRALLEKNPKDINMKFEIFNKYSFKSFLSFTVKNKP